ncbi:protein phosphatase 1 regulatory subunit 12B isoform X3 [Takifugu rubripes]|uniref:protein phosphatase 1 regulatory subunit 12B isoform X3 n=1 Tax=Takifugu rubripes TaxID=31033 RepID=UPI001145F115|nr:protein phosphatase 1 regulatory subunit 12B-like isoform X3 [Takifugu rubripes]
MRSKLIVDGQEVCLPPLSCSISDSLSLSLSSLPPTNSSCAAPRRCCSVSASSTGTMQALASRSYLAPVRDEEAESQRKAKSRLARQTRRSTQGVTLTDLKEAQRSSQDRQRKDGETLDDWFYLRNRATHDGGVEITEKEATETVSNWRQTDEQDIEPVLEALPESPVPTLPYSSGATGLPRCNNSYTAGWRWWNDENANPVGGTASLTCDAKHHKGGQHLCNVQESDSSPAEHDRLSRYESSGDGAADRPVGRTGSYTRRETRLASANRQEQDASTKDYKKMYAEALHENERLKSRLQDSKKELDKIRSQLERVTQRHDRISERSSVLDSERREKQALEKRVSNMEEELKDPPLRFRCGYQP